MANPITVLNKSLVDAREAVQNPNVQTALGILDSLPVGLSRADLGSRLGQLGEAVNDISLPTLSELVSGLLQPLAIDDAADDVAAVLRTSADLVDAAERLTQLVDSDTAEETVEKLSGYVASVGELSAVVGILDGFEGAKQGIVDGIDDVAEAISGTP